VLALVPALFQVDSQGRYTDQATGLQITVPEKWQTQESKKHFLIHSADGQATILVIPERHFNDATDALNKLDRDDVMGGQIKSINPRGEPESKKINKLDAKLFEGTVNISNVRSEFKACIIPREGVCYVAFAYASKEGMKENAKAIQAAFDSIRQRPE
jgi:hypothetical protein